MPTELTEQTYDVGDDLLKGTCSARFAVNPFLGKAAPIASTHPFPNSVSTSVLNTHPAIELKQDACLYKSPEAIHAGGIVHDSRT